MPPQWAVETRHFSYYISNYWVKVSEIYYLHYIPYIHKSKIIIKSSNVVPACRWVANLLVRYRLVLCSAMLKVNQKRPNTIKVKDPQLSLEAT